MGDKPIYTYYWVRVSEGGKACTPQYLFETGQEVMWGDVETPYEQLLLVPFDEDLALKVYRTCGDLCQANNKPMIELNIQKGDVVDVARRGYITSWSDYQCKICGTSWVWDSRNPLICPECGAHNEWKCSACGEVKKNPLFLPRGEVQCPDCKAKGAPRGLQKVEWLQYREHEDHVVHYYTRVEGKFEIEFSEEKIEMHTLKTPVEQVLHTRFEFGDDYDVVETLV
jgi:hypothetical protein